MDWELFDELILPENNDACQHTDVSYENGKSVCIMCGQMMDDIIDTSAEWRYYGAADSKNDNPNRCGMPIDPLLPETSMNTIMVGPNRRIQQLHNWLSRPYRERCLRKMFFYMNEKGTQLGLSTQVIHYANVLCKSLFTKQTEDKSPSRANNRISLIACCLYYSCIKNNIKIDLDNLASAFGLSGSDVTENKKVFIRTLNNSEHNFEINGYHPLDFILTYLQSLKICNIYYRPALKIGFICSRYNLLKEHTPPSIASGIIYYLIIRFQIKNVQGEMVTKKDIHDNIGISEVTITKTCKKVMSLEHYIYPFISHDIKQTNTIHSVTQNNSFFTAKKNNKKQ